MALRHRSKVALFGLLVAFGSLLAAPARAETLWLYDVTGNGFWFENGEYGGQQAQISGTVAIRDYGGSWDPLGTGNWVWGTAEFDLQFMGYDFVSYDQGIQASMWAPLSTSNIGGVAFRFQGVIDPAFTDTNPDGCGPGPAELSWMAWYTGAGPGPNSSYAGPCFGGPYEFAYQTPQVSWILYLKYGEERPTGDPPLWQAGENSGLLPESITLSNPMPAPDHGSTLLLFGVGLLGLRAWRKRLG